MTSDFMEKHFSITIDEKIAREAVTLRVGLRLLFIQVITYIDARAFSSTHRPSRGDSASHLYFIQDARLT
jgi:hypothetical protein